MDPSIYIAIGGFVVTIGSIVWRTGRLQSRTDERLMGIERDIKYLRDNGFGELREDFKECKMTKEQRLEKLERKTTRLEVQIEKD